MSTTSKTTKKGAASLYVVIFTTLLLGIITLGFVRIMLSESLQTSNADLSQSAYDSALAGIEDAKVALLKYHDCLSSNSSSEECQNAIAVMRDPEATQNCDVVREVLRGEDDAHETIIESGEGTGVDMEQAYTCVLVSEDNTDYLGQLNENFRTKMVPIRTDNLDNLKFVKINWYSSINVENTNGTNIPQPTANQKTTNKPDGYDDPSNTGLFSQLDSSNPYAPPTLGVQLFQADPSFRYEHLDRNNGDNTDRGTLLLYPSSSVNCRANAAGNCIVDSNSSTGFSASSDKAINTPIPIKCETNEESESEFSCSAILGIPAPFNGGSRLDGASFLRLFLPYGTPETDFSITLCEDAECGVTLPFIGVQARIDATGRANDLFRRVESRVELVDVYFPFPEYSAAVKSVEADAINKNFWVTRNNHYGKESDYINPDTETLH